MCYYVEEEKKIYSISLYLFYYAYLKIENRRQNVLSFYHFGICQQKWMRVGFESIPTLTRNVLWNRSRSYP